ncbi:MAG: histidine phosphatase family protein [Chthoniobacterales bacterium]
MPRSLILALVFVAGLLATAEAAPTIFLVRHAEKEHSFSANQNNPPLSSAGRKRARALAFLLRDTHPVAIYVTEFARTQETAAPLAAAVRIRPTVLAAKATSALAARLKQTRGCAVVVGHSNTIPEILHALGVESQIKIAETQYDNVFVVLPRPPPRLLRLHY